MKFPRTVRGWLLLFSPAALIILMTALPTMVRAAGGSIARRGPYSDMEFAIFGLLFSIPLSLVLGVWLSRADHSVIVRGVIGVLIGAVLLAVNCGIAFAGCMTLSEAGILR